MIGAVAGEALDPLTCDSLLQRFPHVISAMDPDGMAAALQEMLFAESAARVVACGRPRAEVGDDNCWLQYPLRLCAPAGAEREVLALGVMLSSAADAEAYERRVLAPQADARAPRSTGVLPELTMAVSVFPVNGALPTLARAAEAAHASDALTGILGERVTVRDVALVELRRTRGCVLRYRLDSAQHPVVYGKVGRTAVGDAVEQALRALTARMSGDEIYFPLALGYSDDLMLCAVSAVPGNPPDLSAPAGREQAVDGAARVAVALHGSGVSAGPFRFLHDELSRAADATRLVARDNAHLAARLTGILERIARMESRVQAGEPGLAHGSLAPSQLMLDGSRVGVLDFDRVCQAEPSLDLGRFVAPLRVKLAKLNAVAVDELAQSLLLRYRDGGGRVDEARPLLYECAALVRMAARSWLQLKPSRLRTVLTILEDRASALGVMA